MLKNMWKVDCDREEKPVSRWRFKEIWMLDYERKYRNVVVKEKKKKQQSNLKNNSKT